MRVLQIGADRSKDGILYPGTAAFKRQEAYAKKFGNLDIIAFSRKEDGAREYKGEYLRVIPTNSRLRFFYLRDALRIARTLEGPAIVSAQDPFEAGLAARLIARRFRAALHVQVHTDFLSPAYAKLSLANRMRLALARFILPRTDGVRVVSERIKHSLEKRYALRAPISVLPIFVDIGRIRTAQASAELAARFARFEAKLLVVSRLEPEKNVALAIRAFAQSAPHDACLIIVGEGREKPALERMAEKLGIAERTFFEGRAVPFPYYKLTDLVLVPSKYEGYGLVIIEALVAGRPVLSTDVGIAREAGAIVANESEFSSALARWFENGPRQGVLRGYPYRDFDEYVRAYCDDIVSCAREEKSQ